MFIKDTRKKSIFEKIMEFSHKRLQVEHQELLKPTKAALFGLHMRFRDLKANKVIYKAGQVPRRIRGAEELQITDMKNKHKMPLSLDQFRNMQRRYYENKEKGTNSQLSDKT